MSGLSDNGLIVAYRLDGTGGGLRLDWQQLGRAVPVDAVEWVHLEREHPQTKAWLQQSSGLAPLVVESLLAESTRPHCTRIDDGIMLFLRAVNMNPGADPDDMVSIRLWVDGGRIVSVRKRPLLSVDDLRAAIEIGKGPRNPADFLVGLVSGIGGRITRVLEEMDDTVDDLEQQVLELGSANLRAQLTDTRRQIIALRRYLSPQRDALTRLTQLQLGWLGELDLLHLREEADRVTRFVEDLDAARERAAVTQEELSNRISEQINSRMYVLSLVAAIFLPLGFATGLFGVNVGGIPLAGNPWGFALLAAALACVAALQLLLLRWKGWF